MDEIIQVSPTQINHNDEFNELWIDGDSGGGGGLPSIDDDDIKIWDKT